MSAVLAGLAPIFLLIALGCALRHFRIVDDTIWAPADRLNYLVLFPALLIATMARTDYGAITVVPMAAALALSLGATMAIVLLLHRTIATDGPAFTSVFQGATRFNTFIGLAIAGTLYGQPGLVMAALAVAIMIPLVNTPSVIVLARYGGVRGVGFGGAALAIARNPIILASVVGATLGMTGAGLPPILGPALAILGAAALPLGLIGVGAGLDFAALRAGGRAVAVAATVKLALLPLATYWVCEAIGVDGLTQTVAVLFNALPASVSSYALARQMGGDHRLMAGILTVEMLAAGVTLPVVLALLR